MNAKELMIGDWVRMKVSHYTKWYVNRVSDVTLGSITKYEPIPLTEDILKANGWWSDPEIDDENEKTMFFIYRDYAFAYASYGGLSELTIEQDNIMEHLTCVVLVDEVYNVHELQHALRLCGLNKLADNFKVN